jgi:hypothetical protein
VTNMAVINTRTTEALAIERANAARASTQVLK